MRIQRTAFVLLLIGGLTNLAGQEPVKAATPAAALQAFKTALEQGDFKAVAQHAGGPKGQSLRELAVPFLKAKEANDRLDKAVKDRKIELRNPFAASLTPFAELQFELVDVTTENNQVLARVKCGLRGKGAEETVAVVMEDGWRVTPPEAVVKQLPGADRLKKHATGLDKLAKVLDAVAKEIEAGKATTKEKVLLRLVELFQEEKVNEYLGS